MSEHSANSSISCILSAGEFIWELVQNGEKGREMSLISKCLRAPLQYINTSLSIVLSRYVLSYPREKSFQSIL